MKTIKITNIKWDTDGIPQQKLGLPNEVELNVSDEQYDEYYDDTDALADELSDTYGYCVESFDDNMD